MKILSIGNSFSQDAQRYLHEIAELHGESIKTVNLYIGGCSLARHYQNLTDNSKSYQYEENGRTDGSLISISEALKSDDWDYVTLQQVSTASGKIETYSPYIEALADYVRKTCPRAKILLHQTWAYANGSEIIQESGCLNADDMYSSVIAAYEKAQKLINADGIIPSGPAMRAAEKLGVRVHHDDARHASRGSGRYLLALCWLKKLVGCDISSDKFSAFDIPVSEGERELIIKAVNSVFN